MRTSWIITFAALCGVASFFYTLAIGSPPARRGLWTQPLRGTNATRAPNPSLPDTIEECEPLLRPDVAPTRAVRGGEIHFILARLYEEAERPEDARAMWEEAARLRLASAQRRRDPIEVATAWFQGGWSLWKLGRTGEARGPLAEAERLYAELPTDERDEATWRHLGWARKILGQDVDAAIAWSRAREIVAQAPLTDRNALYNLACYHALLGETEAALNALERSIAAGWTRAARARHDEDLESIWEEPRFQTLLERMTSDSRGFRIGPGQ